MHLKDLKGHLKSVLYLKSPARGKLKPKLHVMRRLLECLTERKNNNRHGLARMWEKGKTFTVIMKL